jgi:NADH-quinone oxidoreductase subunit J
MNLVLFWFWAITAVFAGTRVITSKSPINSVFWLVLAFVNIAFLLLLLGLEFLPILFLIVYVGAIAILFLFVVMLLNIKLVEISENTSRYVPIGFVIGLIFLSQVYSIVSGSFTSFTPDFNYWDFSVIVSVTNIKLLANLLYTKYWIYFLVSSLVLLVGMVAAILLCLYHEKSVRRQDLFAQVATEYDSSVSSYTKYTKTALPKSSNV